MDAMNWLYLMPSLAAILYLTRVLWLLRWRVPAVAVALALMLAVHGSEALREMIVRPRWEVWDVALNWAQAALSIFIAAYFQWKGCVTVAGMGERRS